MKKITHGGFTQGIQTRQINNQGLKIIPLFASNFNKTLKSKFLKACRTRYGTTGSDGSGIPGNGYLMIIDASPDGLCNDKWLIAYANACQLEGNTDRPILGFINFCPNRLDENYPMSKMLLYTAIHEIGHALEFARRHFNCPSLDGVDLENEGSSATLLTHFEKRVVHDELMSGSVELPSIISGLTLSVFQDSGNEPTGPWCDYFDLTRAQCVSYNNAYNYCNMNRFQQRIEPDKQHVTNHVEREFLAGDSKLHDGCALFQPVPNINGTGQTSVCTHDENNQRLGVNPLMQQFGPNSMCVNHGNNERWVLNTNRGIQSTGDMGASCHVYQCGNGLTIMIGPNTISCPKQGGTMALTVQGKLGLIKGFVQCPPCSEVCGVSRIMFQCFLFIAIHLERK
ncbi:unnamed protein product [Schistosoma spindalis]|nr:unnamed protein product [Schistosoma spindale]